MNKIALVVVCFLFFIAACSSDPLWEVSLEQAPSIGEGQAGSILAIKIHGEDGEPAVGLQVKAVLEMVKMDHGRIEADLQEQADGVYQASVSLPMGGQWQATVRMKEGSRSQERTLTFEAGEAEAAAAASRVVAILNGKEIVEEDLELYHFINVLQIEMYRERDRMVYQGDELEQAMKYWDAQEEAAKHKNTLLTQIIRLQAAALLAEEKGFKAGEAEIADAVEAAKAAYAASPAAMKAIDDYGEERFWSKQRSQHERIVLSSKLQSDVIELVKKANPDAKQQEVLFLAEKKYEEILVSQISTLQIEII